MSRRRGRAFGSLVALAASCLTLCAAAPAAARDTASAVQEGAELAATEGRDVG